MSGYICTSAVYTKYTEMLMKKVHAKQTKQTVFQAGWPSSVLCMPSCSVTA